LCVFSSNAFSPFQADSIVFVTLEKVLCFLTNISSSAHGHDISAPQISESVHMDCVGDIRYTNHSCEPNCVMNVGENGCYLVALRDLAEGETVTFDYNTTGEMYEVYSPLVEHLYPMTCLVSLRCIIPVRKVVGPFFAFHISQAFKISVYIRDKDHRLSAFACFFDIPCVLPSDFLCLLKSHTPFLYVCVFVHVLSGRVVYWLFLCLLTCVCMCVLARPLLIQNGICRHLLTAIAGLPSAEG